MQRPKKINSVFLLSQFSTQYLQTMKAYGELEVHFYW